MPNFQKILLVDDDPLQIAILRSYFAALGVETIETAENAGKALAAMGHHSGEIDLIVTDLQMPDMDGIEFLRHLGISKFPGKLAIVSSVKRDLLEHAGRLAKMHNLNLIGQIPKPLTKETLDAVFLKEETSEQPDQKPKHEIITNSELARALTQGEIISYFQPKVEVQTGKIVGAEALARWFRPDGTSVSPEVFVRFAEANDRITELTFYLFEKVLTEMPRFLEIDPELDISFNLAPANIRHISLPDQLHQRVVAAGICEKNLSFEVTENSVINLDTTTLEVLARLRVLGFELAVDDFGTGSSNIQTLRDFPYSKLKIDRSFITDALSNSFSRETVLAAVRLAHEQGMQVVAEGVEDLETWKMLQDLGIETAQGYLLAKPMSAEDFVGFLTQNHSGVAVVAA